MRRDRVSGGVDWPIYRLDQVATRITRRNVTGNTNVLTVSARDGLISQERYFQRRVASSNTRQYFLVDPGDFVYSKSYSEGYPIGSVKSLKGGTPGIVSPLYICFRPNPSMVDERFLECYFEAGMADGEIEWIAKEGSRNHGLLNVGVEDFMSIRLHLPPVEEQRKIAAVLDSADDAIREMIIYIDKVKVTWQRILRDLLAYGLESDGALRSGQLENSTTTPPALIPRSWRVLPLGDLAEYANGYAFEPAEWGETGLPIIRIQNMNGSRDFNFFDGPLHPSVIVDEGDLLFAWSGTRHSSFGPAIWNGPRAALNQHIFKVQEKRSIVRRYFLYLLLENNLERIASSAHGFKDSFVHVKRSELTSVLVAIPPLDEQSRIEHLAKAADNLIGALSAELEGLRRVKISLTSDLLTGQVRVTDGAVGRVGDETR